MTDIKYTCGQIFPSGCTIYTGEIPDFISEDDVACDANVDDILKLAFDKVQLLVDGNNFTQLDKGCLEFDPAVVNAVQLHQLEITTLCDHEDRLSTLEDEQLDIGTEVITIDLKCLAPSAAPCLVGTNTYSLLSVLNLLVNEICTIKSQL